LTLFRTNALVIGVYSYVLPHLSFPWQHIGSVIYYDTDDPYLHWNEQDGEMVEPSAGARSRLQGGLQVPKIASYALDIETSQSRLLDLNAQRQFEKLKCAQTLRMYVDAKWERSHPDVSTSHAFRISGKNEAVTLPCSLLVDTSLTIAGLFGSARGQRPSASPRCVACHLRDRRSDRGKSSQHRPLDGKRSWAPDRGKLTRDGFCRMILVSASCCQPRCLQTRQKKRTRG
jgi:hypothetical protein